MYHGLEGAGAILGESALLAMRKSGAGGRCGLWWGLNVKKGLCVVKARKDGRKISSRVILICPRLHEFEG